MKGGKLYGCLFLVGIACGAGAGPAETCLGHLKDVAKSGAYYWAMRTGDYESTTNAVDRGDGKYTSQQLDRAVIPVCGETERRYGVAPKVYLCDFEVICGGWVTEARYAMTRASLSATIRKLWQERGALCVFSWHMRHPCATNGFQQAAYRFKCDVHTNVIRSILADEKWLCGTDQGWSKTKNKPMTPRAFFMRQLDEIAAFVNGLKDARGKPIPVVIRYPHEMDGSWFWWGKKFCSREEFIAFERLEADYLRKKCGKGRILFAYTPDRYWSALGSEGDGGENFLSWYPGDQYVDIMGCDDYSIGVTHRKGKALTEDERKANYAAVLSRLKLIDGYARSHDKVAGITESGPKGCTDIYYSDIRRLMEDEGLRFAFFCSWGDGWQLPTTPTADADLKKFLGESKVIVKRVGK